MDERELLEGLLAIMVTLRLSLEQVEATLRSALHQPASVLHVVPPQEDRRAVLVPLPASPRFGEGA